MPSESSPRLRVGFGLLLQPTSKYAVSGYAAYTTRLAREIRARGDVDLVPWSDPAPHPLGPHSRAAVVRAAHRLLARPPKRRGRRALGHREHEYPELGAPFSAAAELQITKYVERLRADAIDVFHVTDWGGVGATLFEACRRVGVPCVVSAVDYKPICPQSQLLHAGRDICAGPETPVKCQACLASLARPVTERWVKRRQQRLAHYFSHTSSVITFTDAHARELERWMPIGTDRYDVVPFAVPSPGADYLKDTDAFERPLAFGYIARACREWGIEILLRAWESIDPDPDHAVLRLYTDRAFETDGYRDLCPRALDRGSVEVHIGSVFDVIDDVHASLAAVVVPSQWKNTGSSAALEGLERGTPVITAAAFGVYDDLPSPMRELAYDPEDADASLETILRACIDDPDRLERSFVEPFRRPYAEHAAQIVKAYDRAMGR